MATPKLSLPELASAAANQTLANKTFDRLDQLVQMRVLDKDLAAPPGSPADGAAYIVAAGATGAWAGKSDQIAYWRTAANSWAFLVPANGWQVWVDDEALRYERKAGAWQVMAGGSGGVQSIIIACSDETTALTAGTNKVRFRMPYSCTLIGLYAEVGDTQVSGNILTVDINEAGTSILSTKLTIDNGEEDSATATTPAVISDANLAARAQMSIDIDQVGDGTAKGLKVTLLVVPV